MRSTYKIFIVLASIVFFYTGLYSQDNKQEAYILKYRDIAIRQMEQYGIPASIILAQACLESGNGSSRLAVKANNHFGIKCHDWKGETIRHNDDSKNECFRKYGSAEESFKDHSEFLRYRSRYSFLFSLDIKDYKGWAHGLKAAGYATNPNYANMIINLIEKQSLYKYDNPGVKLPEAPGEILSINQFTPESGSRLYDISLSRTLFRKNGVACVVSTKGESYSSLAKEFSLFKRELLRFNDLKGNPKLEDGTLVYIQRKKKMADMDTPKHIASGNETIHDISQIYGIRLKSLLKLNNSNKDYTPQEGATINLIHK